MKQLLLIVTILFSCRAASFAQKIHFGNNTNVWYYIDSTVGCCIPIPVGYSTGFYDSTPVSLNGHDYQYYNGTVQSFLAREDSNRVYFICPTDSIERVLYDFNLVVNDTTRLIYPEDTFIAWVTNIDSTQLGGIWYKVWHFDGKAISTFFIDSVRPFSYNVIEGIGCTNGVYYPASPFALSAFSQQLLCFKNNLNITTPLSPSVPCYGFTYLSFYDNSVSCNEYYAHHHEPDHTLVKQLATGSGDVVVAPDPATEQSRIILPYTFISGTVTIINQLGQVVTEITIKDASELTFGNNITIQGVYYYRVIDGQTGKTFSGKFIR